MNLEDDDMAKRKKKTTTTSTTAAPEAGPYRLALVATQRAALEAMPTKHDLAALAVKLASQHGSPEQQALGRADVERGTRDAIEALVAELAVKAHTGRKTHLSELGGWPACWLDERREACGPEELLTTPITVSEEAVTCARCKKTADIPTPEESAAMERAEVAAASKAPTKERKQAPKARKGEAGSKRAKRQLTLKENLPVRMKIRDLEVKGVLRPDGTLSARGTSHSSPHEAANALAGDLVAYRIDGFQAWRYQDDQGRWRMLRDHA